MSPVPQDLGKLNVYLNCSTDGLTWQPVGREVVYHGGLTEVVGEGWRGECGPGGLVLRPARQLVGGGQE